VHTARTAPLSPSCPPSGTASHAAALTYQPTSRPLRAQLGRPPRKRSGTRSPNRQRLRYRSRTEPMAATGSRRWPDGGRESVISLGWKGVSAVEMA